MNWSLLSLLCLFLFVNRPAMAQEEMFRQKPERIKVWRKWHKKRNAYNPYLDLKAKDKPSARMAKGERKEIKRQNRAAKKQLKRSKNRKRR
jgi:hypothetical protein